MHEQALNWSIYRKAYVAKVLGEVRRHAKPLTALSDAQLRERSLELRFSARSGQTSGKGQNTHRLAAPAFALVQEAASRALGMRHYDVQLQAGIHLLSKCVVEMQTGEGKTLTALLPLYTHALFGKGVQLATANDYLARRDGDEMRPVFERLGMKLGVIQKNISDQERREAYGCDVTYGTLGEFGFDFLRDRMKRRASEQSKGVLPSRGDAQHDTLKAVCRPLNYILIDEADSIMIDDASTPLIIGAYSKNNNEKKNRLYHWAAEYSSTAIPKTHYRYIEHQKKVELTEAGRKWSRQIALGTPVAGLPSVDHYEFLERAIGVERDYVKDRNYVVSDGTVTIVDENTGRLAVGRFWQDGLHQAIQAREGIQITPPTSSAARLTVQSLILSYPQRSGMTGTASSSRSEFRKVYKMNVVRVPTRVPNKRKRMKPVFRATETAKMQAICDSVVELNKVDRPVLIGSRSVAKSERLSALFKDSGVEHVVLNARNEEEEAAIVALAGEPGRVTISTSMAGRGTDIRLNEIVARSGGLHVLITELNDTQRIDRQLIGRCARQGDPGTFQVFFSLEDDVMGDKSQTQRWRMMASPIALPISLRAVFFRRAQAAITARNTRQRLAMLHSEKKRLRDLRQAGLDPVLDVVG